MSQSVSNIKWLIFIVYFAIAKVIFAQQSNWQRVSFISGNYSGFLVDNFENIFLYSHTKIQKNNPGNAEILSFTDKYSGNISAVSFQNAFKIFVFYKDFKKIKILDNTLSKTLENIDLENLSIFNPAVIGASKDGGFWIFDEYDYSLQKYSSKLSLISNTTNLNAVTGLNIKPSQIFESEDIVYIGDTASGFYLFDLFGNFNKHIPARYMGIFSFYKGNLYFLQQDTLCIYNLQTHDEKKISLPSSNYFAVQLSQKYLYLLNKDGLETFKNIVHE